MRPMFPENSAKSMRPSPFESSVSASPRSASSLSICAPPAASSARTDAMNSSFPMDPVPSGSKIACQTWNSSLRCV